MFCPPSPTALNNNNKKRLAGNPSLLETRKVILRIEADARQITIISAVHPDNKTTPDAKYTG